MSENDYSLKFTPKASEDLEMHVSTILYLWEWQNWQMRAFEGHMGDHVGSSPTFHTKRKLCINESYSTVFW